MKRPWRIGIGLTVALTAILELLYRHHGHAVFWWHRMPVFDFLYGLVGCMGLIWLSKGLGHAWLQRDEAYYGDDQS